VSATDDTRDGDEVHAGTVAAEWIDANRHMNVAYYVLAFDLGVDALWGRFGINDAYIRERDASTFAVECHVCYKRELRLGDPYIVTAQILAYDAKRIHQFMRMYHASEGFLAATCEWLNLHVDLEARRVTPWPEEVLARIIEVADGQRSLRRPADVGGRIGVAAPYWSVEDYSA
jgi:acyl-CoA thioester hydrolase